MKKNSLIKLTLITFAFAISGSAVGQGVIGAGGTYTENFDGIGTTATATLPTGWKIDQGTAYTTGTTATTVAYGTTGTGVVTGTSTGGAVNWGNGINASATDRSVGFLTSNGYTSPRNLFLQLVNNTGSTITSLSIGFDIEKYRSGSRAYDVLFFVSTDGTTWTSVNGGDVNYPANAINTTVSNPPLTTTKAVLITGLSIANNANYYLRWAFTGLGGSTNSQGLGLDNLNISTNPTNYYSKSTGNLNDIANWGTNTDGSGTNPTNFTADYQIFNIQNNATPTIDAAWVVSGKGSKVIVGNGTDATTFTIPSGFAATAVIDVANNATLKMQNSTLPSIGNIAIGSTIDFGQSAGLTMPDRNYPSNLIISGSGVKTWSPGANRTLSGNLTVSSGTFAYGNGVHLTIAGNVQVDAGATISMGSSANRIVASGAGRTFTLNGDARVTSNETQTAAATTPFSYQYNGFTTYTFAPTSWVSFRSPTSTAVTQGIDGITGSPFGNVEIAAITNLTAAGSNTHTFKSDVEIVGTLAFPRIQANTALIINFGANTVKVGGAIQLNGSNTSTQSGGRTYNMGTSTLELNGTVAQNTLGGTDLPNTFNNLTINNAAGVTTNNAITVSGTTTINEGSMLSMGATLTANGAVNVNGTFRLNSSGWATGTGTWTYGSNATLAFNTTYGVNSDHVYWPTSNGPANVSVLTGVLTLNTDANKTVSGLFQTAGGVSLSSATLTLNGTAQINAGGYFSNAPIYGAASTLKYNTGTVYGRSTEWNNPASVQISNNTTLDYPNTGGGAFAANLSIPGNLTVDAGSSLYMDYGGGDNKSGRLSVGGNVVVNGNLSLGNAVGGDLYVGGNWTRAASGSAFAPNSREVRFNGTDDQNITNTGGETFAFLTIANIAGKVVSINDNVTVNNNMLITAASGATNASGKTLAVLGNFTLSSSSDGTATFKNSGTLTVSGSSKVQQYLTNQSWYLSSPVQGTVTPTNLTRIQSYNEGVGTGNDWSVSGTTMTAGKGYITSVNAAPNTVEFTGAINSGDISIPLTRQAATNVNKYGFNLIGNPYTAYLDWEAVAAANVSKMPTSTMWYRTKAGGSWAFSTVNGAGEASPANVSSKIPPMQAFWVRASTVGNSNLELTNNMVVHDNNTSNKLKAPATNSTERTRVRLQVSNSTNTDEMLIYTDAQALNTFDTYDSPKMSNESADIPEISTLIDGQSLVINGMNTLMLDTEIPIRFMTKTANTFTLKANQVSNLPEGIKIILSDFGNEFDLSSGSEYQFTSEVTDNTNRFSLIFRTPGTTTKVNNITDNRIMVYSNNNSITIRVNDDKLIGTEASVYNATGQKLTSKKLTGNTIQFDNLFSANVYIIKVNNITKKVIVK